MMKTAVRTFASVFLFGVCCVMATAQAGAPTVAQAPTSDAEFSPQRNVNTQGPLTTKEQREQMEKAQKAMREKQLKNDSARLLQLATELKASVDKTNQNVLSLDVVKKAEEIEKLAKHIKTNMRDESR